VVERDDKRRVAYLEGEWYSRALPTRIKLMNEFFLGLAKTWWGSETWANVAHDTRPYATEYTIITNGDIPLVSDTPGFMNSSNVALTQDLFTCRQSWSRSTQVQLLGWTVAAGDDTDNVDLRRFCFIRTWPA
jgi:hypothetical protein